MEMHTAETFTSPFLLSVGLGFILAFGWIAAIVGASFWGRIWAWIDDAEKPKRNAITAKIMKARGFADDGSEYRCYKRDGRYEDGFFPVVAGFVTLGLSPSLLLSAIYLYPLTISCLTLYMMARLARFARRHKKLFDKHIADPEAHKR